MKQPFAGQPLDIPALSRQVKAAVLLEDEVRGHGVHLTGRGKRLEGHCPLPGHEDDTPSFNVYLQTQRFYCFGCDSGGDVIDFVQLMDNCSFLEACARLLGTTGAPRGAVSPTTGARSARRHTPPPDGDGRRSAEHAAILTRAMLHYHQAIFRSRAALDYLAERGASLRTVKRCMLGFVDGSFRLSLAGNAPLWQAAEQVGLLTSSGREWLSGRLVIPEVVAGQCTWLIGRVLPTRLPQRPMFADKKYLGLPIDKPLLGYGRALALLEGSPRPPMLGIHIVEGAIDYVITQEWELPFYNLSLLGTHASRAHLADLFSLHERSGGLPFLVNLDGDERGGIGALHLLELLRGYPTLVLPTVAAGKDLGRLAELPDGLARWSHALASAGEGSEWS